MNIVTFDKLRYIEKLEAGGISQEQAKIQADALDDALRESVATKHDLSLMELRLTIRFGAMLIAGIGFLAVIKFFW